jgi:hypothetical protein
MTALWPAYDMYSFSCDCAGRALFHAQSLLEEIRRGGVVDSAHQSFILTLCALGPQEMNEVSCLAHASLLHPYDEWSAHAIHRSSAAIAPAARGPKKLYKSCVKTKGRCIVYKDMHPAHWLCRCMRSKHVSNTHYVKTIFHAKPMNVANVATCANELW